MTNRRTRWIQLAFVVPRAIAFMFGAGRHPRDGVPRLRPSPPTIASVFLDDFVTTMQYVMAGPAERGVDPEPVERAAAALRAAGFSDEPASFHRTPPPPR